WCGTPRRRQRPFTTLRRGRARHARCRPSRHSLHISVTISRSERLQNSLIFASTGAPDAPHADHAAITLHCSSSVETSMKRLLLAAVGVAAAVCGPAAADETHKVLNLDALTWVASPRLPKGAQVAILAGNPGAEGHYVILAKLPDGFQMPAHWHTNA